MSMAFFNFKKASLLLLIAIFQCTLLVSARPQHVDLAKRGPVDASGLLTNAKRMQAGLGPLKPRTLYNPSRVVARDPQPSAVTLSGNIIVKRGDGTEVGYLSTEGYGFVTTQDNDKLEASFLPQNPPFNIAVSGFSWPDLGFVGTSLDADGNAIGMTVTNPTPPGSTSVNVGSPYSIGTESSVWYYSAQDHQLTAQWVNPDGSVLFPSFAYYAGSNRVGLTLVPGSGQVYLYLV